MTIRPTISVLCGLLLGIAAVPVSCLWTFGFFDSPEVGPVPFEVASWRRADPIARHRTVRSQMVDDLMRRKLLDGLPRSAVEQLLGPPNKGVQVGQGHWDMIYHLGLERAGAFSLDEEFLVIRFGDHGWVVEYRTTVN